MSTQKYIMRNEDTPQIVSADKKIICDTAKLKKKVLGWTKNEGWKFEDFTTFVELIGLKTPVRLSHLDETESLYENTFKCITASGKETEILIYCGDKEYYYSEIWVTETEGELNDKVIKRYTTNHKYNDADRPTVTLYSKSIIRDNTRELNCYYSSCFSIHTLKIGEDYRLDIEIQEPSNKGAVYESKFRLLESSNNLERYIISLNDYAEVLQIYDELMELLAFSEEDIAKSPKISISYVEISEQGEVTKNKLVKENGKTREYIVTEDFKTYYVDKDENWKYVSKNTQISYSRKNDELVYSVKESKNDELPNASLAEIIKHVQAYIAEIRSGIF